MRVRSRDVEKGRVSIIELYQRTQGVDLLRLQTKSHTQFLFQVRGGEKGIVLVDRRERIVRKYRKDKKDNAKTKPTDIAANEHTASSGDLYPR